MAQCQFRSDDTVKWWLGFGDGSDGDYSSTGNATDAPIDSSCSGTSGTTSLSATNASFVAGKPVLIHQSRGTNAGNWELNQIDSYVAGTITLKKPLINTYTDSGASQAQVIQLKQYNNFTQNSGHTLAAKAWNGDVGGILAFLAKGTFSGSGSFRLYGNNGNTKTGFTTVGGASGIGFAGGTGYAVSGGSVTAWCGEGTNGGISQTRNSNGSGGGGGGAGGSPQSSTGAGGGNATVGQDGGAGNYGYAGQATGNAGLTIMTFGGGGGGGASSDNNGGGYTLGSGGAGGGILLAIAKMVDIQNMTINLNGGNLGGGTYAMDGGGGAGGSCLIKTKIATLGTNKITATGGAGGGYGGGGGGSVGRIHLDYSVSYTGTTTPTLDYTLDKTITEPVSGGSSYAFFM